MRVVLLGVSSAASASAQSTATPPPEPSETSDDAPIRVAPPPSPAPAPSQAKPARGPTPAQVPAWAPGSAPPAGYDSFAPPSASGSTSSRAAEGGSASEWYGLPLVVADGLALGIAGVGRAARNDTVFAVGVADVMVNGLLVHWLSYPVHEQGVGLLKGLLSVAMRVGLGVGACAIGSDCFDQTLSDGAAARLVLGLVVAAALDDSLLARRALDNRPPAPALRVLPTLAASPSGFSLGAAGAW